MAKYIVTGGETGEAQIEIKGKIYSSGDTVELTGKQDLWLVEQGHLASTKQATATKGTK